MGAAAALAWTVAVGRVGTGGWFLASPERPAEQWVGSTSPSIRYLMRAVGGRDLAIGAGVAGALLADKPVTPWLVASAGADLVDAAASLGLDAEHRRGAMSMALPFAALGAVAALANARS